MQVKIIESLLPNSSSAVPGGADMMEEWDSAILSLAGGGTDSVRRSSPWSAYK